jgi:hypothetical protein
MHWAGVLRPKSIVGFGPYPCNKIIIYKKRITSRLGDPQEYTKPNNIWGVNPN